MAYARAAYRLAQEGQSGCRTVFDIAPAYLSAKSPEELRKNHVIINYREKASSEYKNVSVTGSRQSAESRKRKGGVRNEKAETRSEKTIEEKKAVLGIELGSTRIKAVLIDEDKSPVASGSYDWENKYVNHIWTYDMDEIWKGLRGCYGGSGAECPSENTGCS